MRTVLDAVSRRSFFAAGPVVVLGAAALARGADAEPAPPAEDYPVTASQRAKEFVGACHVKLDRVREMLAEDAGLAKAAWDWGFGDWESGIGACSHTGRKDIIELLIAHGARPTLFTLATLDEVDAVRAIVGHVYGGARAADAPRIEGPHSISLYEHAEAGDAARVMEYLASIGRGERPDPFAMARSDAERYFGTYAWGQGASERFVVDWFERRSTLRMSRAGAEPRNMMPLDGGGDPRFSPAGARHVVARFEMNANAAARLIINRAGGDLVSNRV